MKVKTVCTLYFDYDSNSFSFDKPDGKYKEDYDFLRTGSILEVYSGSEATSDFGADEKYEIICFNRASGWWLGFENWHQFKKCNYLEVIE